MHDPIDLASPAPIAASLSRRRLLALGAAGLGALALPAAYESAAQAAADPYAVLRANWAAYLTGGAINPSDPAIATAITGINALTQAYLANMQTGSGRTLLWPDLPLGSVSNNLTVSFERLGTLASAYVTPGTNYTGSASLASTITSGLDFMVAGPYAPSVTDKYNNWWDWQIGCVHALENTAVLMYGELTATEIADYCASIDAFLPSATVLEIGTATGANLLDACQGVIVRGALGEDSAKIGDGVAGLIPALTYVMSGDGLYADGSFLQHSGVPYNGGYGATYFSDIAGMVLLLQGSSWAIPATDLSDVVAGVANGTIPLVYNGLMLDAVRGRFISSHDNSDATEGFWGGAVNLLRYAQVTDDPALAAAWQSIAKGWLQRNTACTITTTQQAIVDLTTGATVTVSNAGVASIALAETVLGDSSVSAAAEPVAHQQFPNMDRAIHRRPGWAYAISMCSDNIDRYEVINTENLHGWYTGDGVGYLYLDSDITQFNDAYWDTVDMYQLPGVTADGGTLANSAGQSTRPASAWAGGSVVNGTYGAVGMQLQAYSTNLTAAKSWFCLDSSIVCLGAGITSSSGNPVLTTVENRNLHTLGSGSLYINGTEQSISVGWSIAASAVHSACITGVAGYAFLWPAGANNIEFALTDQTGNWLDVAADAPTTLANDTRPYLSIAFNHGASPADATYSYVILPNATEAQTATYAAAPSVSVVSNTATMQAITDASLGVTMANFYAAGTAGPITVNAPASVCVQTSGSQLAVAVSDPTWKNSTVEVTVAASGYASIVSADPSVTVLSSSGGSIQLLVECGGSRGASHSVTLSSTGTALTPAGVHLLTPTDDTYVQGGTYAADNYGTATQMAVKNATGQYERISLVKFSTSSVTGTVSRAILWVNGAVSDTGGTQTGLTAYGLSSDSWTETSVTFTTAPGLTTAYGSGQISSLSDWVGLDVTGLVQGDTDGQVAIGIYQQSAGLATFLNTKESGSATSPVLEVITH